MNERVKQTFAVPLAFPNISSLRGVESDPSEYRNIVETSLLDARPTVLQCWTHLPKDGDDGGGGVIVGCDDGTLYVFHQTCQPINALDLQSVEIIQPSPQPKPSRRPRRSSRSGTPPTPAFPLSATFNVSARSRVVSGVTTDPVEAPKNYVDFDDEPDKLKDILKGRTPKEKHAVSDPTSEKNGRLVKSPAASITEPASSSKHRKPRSLLSATNSPGHTPYSFSVPASPKGQESFTPIDPPHEMSLRYHIIPSKSGSGRAVRSVQMLQDNRFIAVLHETGDLYVFSSEDGICVACVDAGGVGSPMGVKDRDVPDDIWEWCSLSVAYVEQSTILLATAATDANTSAPTPDMDESSTEKSQGIMLEFLAGDEVGSAETKLSILGQWEFDGPAKGLGIHIESDKTSTLYSINSQGCLHVRQLCLRPPPPSPPIPVNAEPEHHLPIPNPFKGMMSRSSEHLSHEKNLKEESKVTLNEVQNVGRLLSDSTLSGLCARHVEGRLYGIAWDHREMTVFVYEARSLKVLYQTSISSVGNVEWLDESTYALTYDDRVEVYQLKRVTTENETADSSTVKNWSGCFHPDLLRTLPIGPHNAITLASPPNLIVIKVVDGQRQLVSFNAVPKPSPESLEGECSRILWHSNPAPLNGEPKITLTSMFPLDLDRIIQGYSDGRLRQYSIPQMSRKGENPTILTSSSMKTSEPALNGYILALHLVQNQRTKEKYLLGGADDGSIAFWSSSTFELCARWIMFTTPLVKVLTFEGETVGPLRGCVLCIARDGTIAVIVVDGFQFLYLVPGAAAPLQRICVGGNSLLLIYSNRRARLWDAQTKELWRSMGLQKAQEMLAQGGWTCMTMEQDTCIPSLAWASIAPSFEGRDAASTLSLDLERLVVDSVALTKTISTSRDEIRNILLTLDRLRLILSILLTPGLSDDVDSICDGKLKVMPSSAIVGLCSDGATVLYPVTRPRDVWCISGNVSAARALSIILVLRAMSLFEELSEAANTVISFYATSVGTCVGERYQPPSLEYLARRWFAASNELRQAIRLLFDATLARLSDEEAIAVAEKWQHHVPTLQPDAERETINAALALFICGCIASEKYTLLSTNSLTDISKSITLYLHDESSVYRVLAIDLCSRGFHVWQHYVDAMEILRSLFMLSTNVRKDSISIQNVNSQARLAVLSIASNNIQLFMSTLCLDILTPPTLEHRRSVMQIVAFMIRKRPHILQPTLPRLLEAVIKSLDPNSTANRDAVLDTATEIIGYVVKTFPTVDFHMATQRLAVGSNEGAVVMYDLKTAIRLYVLEGHTKQISGCSFSPDGRRLVTLSLSEGLLLVWKVGSSFSSFFNPGAPPRQGHGGSQPFKTLNFNIGTESDMSLTETLELVNFEWVADRSVRVRIRESILTFST